MINRSFFIVSATIKDLVVQIYGKSVSCIYPYSPKKYAIFPCGASLKVVIPCFVMIYLYLCRKICLRYMKYKVLVLDLDGTLTNGKKQVTPHTLNRLKKAQEQGVKIVLASGRPTYGVAPIADLLELDKHNGYILSYNGGEIIQWKNREKMHQKVLDPAVLPYLYDCAKQNEFAILTYQDNNVLTEHPNNEYVLREAHLNVMNPQKVENFLDAITFPVAKCLIVGEPERLAKLEVEMQRRLCDRMEVYRSEPYFLELVPKGIDKANSLSLLLDKLGLSSEEMICVGDGFNDISMITYAGLGVAMANAQPQVRDKADYITLSNEEDGVAVVVDKFILN
jgi:hypothetical protein